jgi:hypothetical protein
VGLVAAGVSGTSCTIDLVELPPVETRPAAFFLRATMVREAADTVSVSVEAALDAGVVGGVARPVDRPVLILGGEEHLPEYQAGPDSLANWTVELRREWPSYSTLAVTPPTVRGLLPLPEFGLPLGIDLAVLDSGSLSAGEDVVLRPSRSGFSPYSVRQWELRLIEATSAPNRYSLVVSGSGDWPEEVRIPGSLLPSDPTALDATFRVLFQDTTSGTGDYEMVVTLAIETRLGLRIYVAGTDS